MDSKAERTGSVWAERVPSTNENKAGSEYFNHLDMSKLILESQGSRRVGKGIVLHTKLVEDRKVEVGQGHAFVLGNGHRIMGTRLITPTGHENGEVVIGVGIAIAHSTSEKNGRFVQKRGAVRRFGRLELIEKLGKTFHLVGFETKQGIDIFLLFPMVGISVVSISKPKQSRIELGSRHFEAGDSGGIGFKSQANQLVKQRNVFHEVAVLRFLDGGFGLGDRMPYAPFLNFGFHVPDRSEVLVQLVPIPAVEPLAKVTRTLKIGVQNGLLEMELVEQVFLVFGFVGDEELAKKITRTFDRWNAHPRSGP